jgi:hypothetical protein
LPINGQLQNLKVSLNCIKISSNLVIALVLFVGLLQVPDRQEKPSKRRKGFDPLPTDGRIYQKNEGGYVASKTWYRPKYVICRFTLHQCGDEAFACPISLPGSVFYK